MKTWMRCAPSSAAPKEMPTVSCTPTTAPSSRIYIIELTLHLVRFEVVQGSREDLCAVAIGFNYPLCIHNHFRTIGGDTIRT